MAWVFEVPSLGGGAAEWGSITGTLSDQADLQAALNNLVPYSGAGADIDLGNTQKVVNCQDPVNAQDVATKNYVDTGLGSIYVPYTGATANVDLGSYDFNANVVRGAGFGNQFNQLLIDTGSFAYYDGAGIVAINMNSRQMLDAGGSYPSIDWGTYGLFNIGITNSYPLLDWSTGAGGSVKIYDGYNGVVVGDFTNRQLNDSGGNPTLDWGLRVAYDNTNSISVDWDYHILSANFGVASIDWQNKYLYSNSFGAVIAVDYGQHFLNNGGGFLCMDFTSHILYDITGTTPVLNFSAQQPSSGAQTAGGTYGATEQTMIQEMYDALRVYGLLS